MGNLFERKSHRCGEATWIQMVSRSLPQNIMRALLKEFTAADPSFESGAGCCIVDFGARKPSGDNLVC